MPLEPGTLARSWQPDRQHHNPLGRSLCRSGNRRWRRSLGQRSRLALSTRSFGGRIYRFRRILGDAFRSRRSECLGHGLLAPASTAATSTTASPGTSTSIVSAALLAGRFRTICGGWLGAIRGLWLIHNLRSLWCFGSFLCGFRRLTRFKICWLQGRWRWFAVLLSRFLFATLHAVAHPFTHVQACNTDAADGAIRRTASSTINVSAQPRFWRVYL